MQNGMRASAGCDYHANGVWRDTRNRRNVHCIPHCLHCALLNC